MVAAAESCPPHATLRSSSIYSSIIRAAAVVLRKVEYHDTVAAGRYFIQAAAQPALRLMETGTRTLQQLQSPCGIFTGKGASSAILPTKAQEWTEKVPVDLKLASGADYRIHLEAETNVAQLGEQVFQITGIPLQHQVIVIVEDRARLPGIFKMARKVQNSLTTSRLDLRSALISWVNFIFLPEVFNREFNGRGVISWAKGTNWYQSLQETQNRAATVAGASQVVSATTAKIQIEQLSGKVLLMEVETAATISELRAAIERRLGILKEQQRILVLEKRGPGRLTAISNVMLLHSISGLKMALGAVAWTGHTTINEIRSMLDGGSEPGIVEDVQVIHFPSPLPPIHADLCNSHVIKAASV